MIRKIVLVILTLIIPALAQSGNTRMPSISEAGINITFGGKFFLTGTFPTNPTERLDVVVTRVYREGLNRLLDKATNPKEKADALKQAEGYAMRNLKMIRASGEVLYLDLLKFRLTGDHSQNPYLKNDDVIIFPAIDIENDNFKVTGAVNAPGRFQFVEGDKLKDAIFFAQGLNKAYQDVDSVTIYRVSYDGAKIETIDLPIDADYPLKRGDIIKVGKNTPQRKNYRVLVLGEVSNPGFIQTSRDPVQLRDIIKRAGGLSENASQRNIRIFKSDNFPPNMIKFQFDVDYKPEEIQDFTQSFIDKLSELEILTYSRMADLTELDTAYFNLESRLKTIINGQVVDLTISGGEFPDITIVPGDIVVIPRKEEFVEVIGQVPNPGRYKYVEGMDYRYYLEKAGGLGEFAEEDELRLIRGNTKEWISIDEDLRLNVNAGDFIYVPKERIRTFGSYIGEFAYYLGIIGNLATILILVLNVSK